MEEGQTAMVPCPYCEVLFEFNSEYETHVNDCERQVALGSGRCNEAQLPEAGASSSSFVCSICGCSFNVRTNEEVAQHYAVCDREDFDDDGAYAAHLDECERQASSEKAPCTRNGAQIGSKTPLGFLKFPRPLPEPIHCDNCQRDFDDDRTYALHLDECEQQTLKRTRPKIHCGDCGLDFKDDEAFAVHLDACELQEILRREAENLRRNEELIKRLQEQDEAEAAGPLKNESPIEMMDLASDNNNTTRQGYSPGQPPPTSPPLPHNASPFLASMPTTPHFHQPHNAEPDPPCITVTTTTTTTIAQPHPHPSNISSIRSTIPPTPHDGTQSHLRGTRPGMLPTPQTILVAPRPQSGVITVAPPAAPDPQRARDIFGYSSNATRSKNSFQDTRSKPFPRQSSGVNQASSNVPSSPSDAKNSSPTIPPALKIAQRPDPGTTSGATHLASDPPPVNPKPEPLQFQSRASAGARAPDPARAGQRSRPESESDTAAAAKTRAEERTGRTMPPRPIVSAEYKSESESGSEPQARPGLPAPDKKRTRQLRQTPKPGKPSEGSEPGSESGSGSESEPRRLPRKRPQIGDGVRAVNPSGPAPGPPVVKGGVGAFPRSSSTSGVAAFSTLLRSSSTSGVAAYSKLSPSISPGHVQPRGPSVGSPAAAVPVTTSQIAAQWAPLHSISPGNVQPRGPSVGPPAAAVPASTNQIAAQWAPSPSIGPGNAQPRGLSLGPLATAVPATTSHPAVQGVHSPSIGPSNAQPGPVGPSLGPLAAAVPATTRHTAAQPQSSSTSSPSVSTVPDGGSMPPYMKYLPTRPANPVQTGPSPPNLNSMMNQGKTLGSSTKPNGTNKKPAVRPHLWAETQHKRTERRALKKWQASRGAVSTLLPGTADRGSASAAGSEVDREEEEGDMEGEKLDLGEDRPGS